MPAQIASGELGIVDIRALLLFKSLDQVTDAVDRANGRRTVVKPGVVGKHFLAEV
jgi:hypothetical protein